MKKGILVLIALVAAYIASGGCIFGPQPFKGVMSYRNGRVYLRRGTFYRVGKLPAEWERMRTRARAISFYNPKYRSSISTDAYCGRSVGDRSLDSLGGEIISALEDRTVIEEENFSLNRRGAVRQLVKGSVDGVAVVVDLVIVRKDGCVFDLYATMPPERRELVRGSFETFFGGFSYGD